MTQQVSRQALEATGQVVASPRPRSILYPILNFWRRHTPSAPTPVIEETAEVFDLSTPVGRLKHLAQMFRHRYPVEDFKAVFDIERLDERSLSKKSTNNTIFAPIVDELNRIGVPTLNTIGSVMRALSLDRSEVHRFGCYCHTAEISGSAASSRLNGIAHRKLYPEYVVR